MSKKEQEKFELTDEDIALLKAAREKSQVQKECFEEIAETLKKYNCKLIIDPQSPHGAPMIIVVSL